MKARTGAPAELPATVIWNRASLGALYAVLAAASRDGYEIDFTSDPTCGFPECEDGVLFSGTASGAIDTSDYRTTSTVTLANGLIATVGIPFYRQPPTITWDRNGRRYLLALPVANVPADLVAMANSMTRY